MKRIKELLIFATLAALLIACATVAAAPRAESAATSSSSQNPPRAITVVGTGKVSPVPDVAQVNVGAEARAETVSEAKAEVDRRMAAIMTALNGMGIDEVDIQTSHFSIYYEREPMHPIPEAFPSEGQAGYRVSNLLRVTVRDIEKAGDVLDAAVDAGANQVHGVTFTASDESGWQGHARQKATEDAKARAVELAGLAGVELGAVQSVSEVIGAWPEAMAVAPERIITGGFAAGELELSTRVQVTYAIQ